MAELSEAAKQRIEDVRQGRSTTLSLVSMGLTEIPKEVFRLTQLEELEVRENQIRVVPERLRELPNLKSLDIALNPIESLPDICGLALDWNTYFRCRSKLSRENIDGIWVEANQVEEPAEMTQAILDLPKLRVLALVGFDQTSTVPTIHDPIPAVRDLVDSIHRLEMLQELGIACLRLGDVPSGIRRLRNLRKLFLAFTGIREIPVWLSELNITELQLVGDELDPLPEFMAELSNLTVLNLAANRFRSIPDVLFRVTSLVELDLSAGSEEGLIQRVPREILDLVNLKKLSLDGQPIDTPPPEVVREGVEAIKNYWRQQEEAGVDYLCEAKLLILGEGGAGKTSLANKIRSPQYPLRSSEPSTEGIEVLRWDFPAGVRVKERSGEKLIERDFRVNIWDFGGQEVYHSTHQFFLTRRSLYVLVADDRKEDTDFNYWLQIVELLSDGSPLLIVQNEKQDRRRDIDLGHLRARFPNLKGSYRVNLADNRGLDALIGAMRQELEHLPHIGLSLPKTWKTVRETLETDPRNHIDLEEYLAICQENDFKRREDKLQLSSYLHDLGICLHFQDDPLLKRTVILRPKWGTDAVYRVLDDGDIIERHGSFGPEDLARIWSEETYAPMRDELLALMMRFQLCYQLPESDSYIAPQLLSPSQPKYEWDGRGNLAIRYEYEFIPKGLITRVIVALNHRIADHKLVWKSGVIFERDGTRAEVIEDYARRKITVRVAGQDARALLAIVDDRLESIHRGFPPLKYDKFLPCNCAVCQTRSEPFAFSLSELKDFAGSGDMIQCRTSRKMVDAASLVREMFPAALPPKFIGMNPFARPPETTTKEVLVSYAWTDESNAVVDQIGKGLKDRGIGLIRDKNEMRYKDSIRDFMKRIGRGGAIVVVLSKQYLESKSCMFELTEIAKNGEMRDRVFPVVLEDADIYDSETLLKYVKYWKDKKDKLNAGIAEVGSEKLPGVREDLDLYTDIRNTITGLTEILRDMNALNLGQAGADRTELLKALETRLTG